MDQPLNSFGQASKSAKVCDVCDITLYQVANGMILCRQCPRIGLQLLDAKGNAFFFQVHTEDKDIYFLADL